MVRYLRKWGKEYNINTLKFKKKMVYNSLVQLLCILPKKSWNLLPVGARKTAGDSESGIAHYYPDTFELDMWFKRYYWQCEPELPLIDIELFKEVAKSYPGKLPIVLFLENSDQTFNKVRFSEIRLSPESDCLKEIRLKLEEATVKIGI